MNLPMKVEQGRALSAMTEQQQIEVLRNSLYPGAQDGSIKMVLGYCRAAGLDPMQKPVHIVPMSVKVAGSNPVRYEWRDVIMPGVGLYRTQASRTDRFAGQSEPEFGPMVTQKLGGKDVTFPEWCRVTVRKLMPGGVIADFPAKEYWVENYATAGKDTEAPNAMWTRRPRGQLAKCAEAQALRKAFPELGAQPTAEEMEGRVFDPDADTTGPALTSGKPEVAMPQARQQADDTGAGVTDVEAKDRPASGPAGAAPDGSEGVDPSLLVGEGEKAYILQKMNRAKITLAELCQKCDLPARENLNGLAKDEFFIMKKWFSENLK